MSGKRGGFSDAVARFTAEVSDAVTNARRAAADAREQSAKFRRGTEELRAKPTRPTRPPVEEPPPPPPEDEDFSQHRLLDDDAPPVPRKSAEDSAPQRAEPVETMTDPVPSTGPEDPHTGDDEDFSQQRILVDATPESYRPQALGTFDFDLPDPEKPS
jgi:hypothetical protein